MNEIARVDDGERKLLTMLLRTAGAIQDRLGRAVEAESGLSLAKLGVLSALVGSDGALPLGRLADHLACARSNVTQLVDRLEAEGLVRREPDPEDRRSTLAVITEEGRRRCASASRAQDAAEQAVLTRMRADRREQLASLLREIGAVIG